MFFQTSLEIAVENEIDPQIVKILLEEGAQPVALKSMHDSAFILASKKAPKYIPLLSKYINEENKIGINLTGSEGKNITKN